MIQQAKHALANYKEILSNNMNVAWVHELGDLICDAGNKAAQAFAQAFDEQQQNGLGFSEFDKHLAMARILGRGVKDRFADEQTIEAIDKYMHWLDSWQQLE
jgi:hypothetical protein